MKIVDKLKLSVIGLTLAVSGVAMPMASAAVRCLDGSERETLSECGYGNSPVEVADFTKNVINTFIAVIGFLAVVVIIYGGFLYTTSAGDSSKVTKAKNTIMYGVIGLVVAILAFAIVNFVLANVLKKS